MSANIKPFNAALTAVSEFHGQSPGNIRYVTVDRHP
jgi:hypothetical protein